MNTGFNRFGSSAPVVMNLIFINVLMLIATYVLDYRFNVDLTSKLALYYPESSHFQVHQIFTHMFMHGGITHLFFNMFALWMFGRALENAWGSKRFLFFYLITGLGAAALHTFVNYVELSPLSNLVHTFVKSPNPDLLIQFSKSYIEDPDIQMKFQQFASSWKSDVNDISMTNEAVNAVLLYYDKMISIPTVGASGAVYGVLIGFGMLFPNTVLMLLFPPIPIKAKYLVMIFAAMELYLGISQPGSNIAHFAHLGGMLFGFLLIKYWNSKRTNFY
jgi:membrane associated rhomboid family serine protease